MTIYGSPPGRHLRHHSRRSCRNGPRCLGRVTGAITPASRSRRSPFLVGSLDCVRCVLHHGLKRRSRQCARYGATLRAHCASILGAQQAFYGKRIQSLRSWLGHHDVMASTNPSSALTTREVGVHDSDFLGGIDVGSNARMGVLPGIPKANRRTTRSALLSAENPEAGDGCEESVLTVRLPQFLDPPISLILRNTARSDRHRCSLPQTKRSNGARQVGIEHCSTTHLFDDEPFCCHQTSKFAAHVRLSMPFHVVPHHDLGYPGISPFDDERPPVRLEQGQSPARTQQPNHLYYSRRRTSTNVLQRAFASNGVEAV